MADPLAQTFQILATTANPFAGELLIAALDVPLDSIQSEAVESLVGRGVAREQMEAIRRYPRFSLPIRKQLERSAALLASLAANQTIVMVIDDVQWADTDSIALLREILHPPNAPRILCVITRRSDGGAQPDLPGSVTTIGLGRLSPEEGKELIRLIAPTTRPQRMAAAVEGAQGFVYLVARLGVTGASSSLAADLAQSVERLRGATRLPVAVGFGISSAEQARTVARLADGVVVGSALVDALGDDGVAGARRFLHQLRAGLDPAPAMA